MATSCVDGIFNPIKIVKILQKETKDKEVRMTGVFELTERDFKASLE